MVRALVRTGNQIMIGLSWLLALGLSDAAWASSAPVCASWPPQPHAQVRELSPCLNAPVARQIGDLCVHHEWRCGVGDFGGWFARWIESVSEPFAASLQGDYWVYHAVSEEVAWAVFWSPAIQTNDGFVVLVSRLRPAKARP